MSKQNFKIFCLTALLLMTSSACGLVEDEGHCPTVVNENIYTLNFENADGTPITDGFYGTVELADGEEYSFACPYELGDVDYPPEGDFQCISSDDTDAYDQLRMTGAGIPEIVAVTASTADDSHHFDGDIELDINSSQPRCGGGYKTGGTTILLDSE